jgi:hypothetical protein
MLTTAPLLVAELARRRPTPVDLTKPFSPNQVRLGWFEITILIGGLRSMLAAAEASGIASAGPAALLGARGGRAEDRDPRLLAPDTPCDNLKSMLDSRVPLASTAITGFVGDQIKGFIQNFVNELFGAASAFAVNVGRAFKVLSVLFKVQALMMFYSEARVKVELDPAFYHQPDGSKMSAGAVVRAGIEDAAWEAAKQARQLSPFATALRTCARFLGLPVWQDLVDIGDAVSAWKVQWDFSKVGGHVEIPTRDQFQSGRFERSLTPESDHSGVDAIEYSVLPERREDHPGTEVSEPVEFCAFVFAKEPPGGVGTILSAGGAGASLAGGAYLGLVAVIAKLLTSWIATVVGQKGCATATVSYHIPMPGAWHGTITVNTESHEQSSSTQTIENGPPRGTTTIVRSESQNADVTDIYYVSGDEQEVGTPYIPLMGYLFTSGAASITQIGTFTNAWTHGGCGYDKTETWQAGGGWSNRDEAFVGIDLGADGSYRISASGSGSKPDVEVPGSFTLAADVHSEGCVDNASGIDDRSYFPTLTGALMGENGMSGQLDPKNPGNKLTGSYVYTSPEGWVSTVSWNLTRDGTIVLPTRF